jgi:IrrE N-terminal-like domain
VRGPKANRYLNRLCSSTNENDPRAAVAALVRSCRAHGEPLAVLARQLGVSDIVEEPLRFDGGVFELPNGQRTIKLNANSTFVRKRFTLAHEIGHLLLGKPGLRSPCGDDPELEKACDAIASELLMPSQDTTEYVKSLGQPSPDKLKMIASNYRVSMHSAAIRVQTDLRLWKCFIGLWERYPNVRTVWFVGRKRWDWNEPSTHSLDLALSSETAIQCTESWQRGPFADHIALNLLRTQAGRVLGLVGFAS